MSADCRICGKYVRHGGIFCRGVCQAWWHLKCINVPYSSVKEEELSIWKCKSCLQNTTLVSSNESEMELSLAEEIQNTILEENESFKQELHN